jgi:acetyl-CoA C-acetyltransferase
VKEVVIVNGYRTPFGKLLGGLSSLSAPQLASLVIKHLVDETRLPGEKVDEVILGNVLSSGLGQAPARQAALHAGLPPSVSAMTVNKVCGSGLQAVMTGAALIQSGNARVVIAGGMESMSQSPFLLNGHREGKKLGHDQIVDAILGDGLIDAFSNVHMGTFADETAHRASISREAQDEFALESHRKAAASEELVRAEIVPISVRIGKDTKVIQDDESIRADISLEGLARLPPYFSPQDGTVTAGNASPLNDGAAVLLLSDTDTARDLSLLPRARILGFCTSGTLPKDIFFAPGIALCNLVQKLNLTSVRDFDLLEVNEAFAAQVLANEKELRWERNKLNVWGGAIARGHPIGASGARVLLTLINSLSAHKRSRGAASLCLGGGNAVAMAVEMIN